MRNPGGEVVFEEQFQIEQGNTVLFPKEFERQPYQLEIYLDGKSNGTLEASMDSPDRGCSEPTIWIILRDERAEFELNCTLPPNKSVIENRTR